MTAPGPRLRPVRTEPRGSVGSGCAEGREYPRYECLALHGEDPVEPAWNHAAQAGVTAFCFRHDLIGDQ